MNSPLIEKVFPVLGLASWKASVIGFFSDWNPVIIGVSAIIPMILGIIWFIWKWVNRHKLLKQD